MIGKATGAHILAAKKTVGFLLNKINEKKKHVMIEKNDQVKKMVRRITEKTKRMGM